MEMNVFEDRLIRGINKLDADQIVKFSWLCAMRVLPFIGMEGNFDFWNEKFRQRNLYSLFYTLDYTNLYLSNFKGQKIDSVDFHIELNSNNSSKAINAAKAIMRLNEVYLAAANANVEIVRNVSIACAKYIIRSFLKEIDFDAIFIKDLRCVYQNKVIFDNSNLYKYHLSNFSRALMKEGCSYWYNVFISTFESGFTPDIRLMEQRLSVPSEIRYLGAAAVASYLEELEKGSNRLNEARILILGDKGAGKTCLARRLIDPRAQMTKEEESTPGVDTTLWRLEKDNLNIHIWDFAGHTVTHAVHQFFLSERCLYIIVFDGRTEGNGRWEYWLDHMKNYGKDSKAILLVNKRDVHAVEVPINKLKEQYPILDICTFSIRDDKANLEGFRQMVANYINNNPSWSNQLIPESSYKVKIELEKLFNNGDHNGKELIERKDFDEIADKCKVEKDKVDGLLSDLHALGISLWYKDMEKYNTMVLNPEWISNGVYRIINWANNQRKHCLKIGEFSQVFEKESTRYPEEQHRFLFELMKKYELAYEAKEKDTLIIPRLLHEDQPDNMPPFNVGESLMARYKADQPLMPDTISRFIVRHNEEIKIEGKNNYLVWRSGVILEEKKHKGTIALVRESDDRTIAVSVKGPNKTEYLSTLRETLNSIFEDYKSKKPELQYRVERFGEISAEIEKQDPLWLADQAIYAHAQQGIPFFDPKTGRQMILSTMVVNYNIQGDALFGSGNLLDKSVNYTTINIQEFQGNIEMLKEDVVRELKIKKIPQEDIELITSDIEVAETSMKEIETAQKQNQPLPEKSKSRLKQFFKDLGDENSDLHKKMKLLRKGRDHGVNLAELYNKIAANTGMPLVSPLALEVIKKL